MIYLVSIACQAAMASGLHPALQASPGDDSVGWGTGDSWGFIAGRVALKPRGESSSQQQVGDKCCSVSAEKCEAAGIIRHGMRMRSLVLADICYCPLPVSVNGLELSETMQNSEVKIAALVQTFTKHSKEA